MRRRSRECALQILYQLDVAGDMVGPVDSDLVDQSIGQYWANLDSNEPADRAFAERLVRGVLSDLGGVDDAIAQVSHHWRIGRMSAVDRNLLRVAAYEIMRCPDIPKAASINEALEIAKRFSGGDARAFINGILDKLTD